MMFKTVIRRLPLALVGLFVLIQAVPYGRVSESMMERKRDLSGSARRRAEAATYSDVFSWPYNRDPVI